MSYEQFRHSILARLSDIDIPVAILNRVLQEIDVASQDFKFDRQCVDLISVDEGVQPIIKMFVAALAVRNCAKGTLTDYAHCLQHMFESIRKPYNTVTTNDIRLYLFSNSKQHNWLPSTLEHKRVVINAFYNWCVDEEYISRNPARTIPVTKVPKKKLKPLKQIELEKMRDACKTPRERAIVDVLFASGIRVSEAAALTTQDLNWEEHTIFVRHGKGDKERSTCFNPEAEVSIRNYLKTRKGSDDHLFCKSRAPYTGITKEAIEAEIRKIRSRVPDLSVKATPHTFRRTTATIAADRGMPVEEIQALLGHESIETTMRYITTNENRVRSDYARYLAG